MSCGVGCIRGLALAWLWLWPWLAAVDPIRPLAGARPYAAEAAIKSKKRKKKKKRKEYGILAMHDIEW